MIINTELLNKFIKETEEKPEAHKFFKGLLESEKVVIIEITDEYNHMAMSLKVNEEIHIDYDLFSRGDVLRLYIDTVEGDFDTFIESKNRQTYGSKYVDFNSDYTEI